jgi:hypothetical protein
MAAALAAAAGRMPTRSHPIENTPSLDSAAAVLYKFRT